MHLNVNSKYGPEFGKRYRNYTTHELFQRSTESRHPARPQHLAFVELGPRPVVSTTLPPGLGKWHEPVATGRLVEQSLCSRSPEFDRASPYPMAVCDSLENRPGPSPDVEVCRCGHAHKGS